VIEFVEECRREWKRLRVPGPAANEMAADLEADLKEAEADGASAEEVLGSGAFDPRGFAAAWATARGLVPTPPEPQPASLAARPSLLRSRLVLPFALSALAVLIGLVLASRRMAGSEAVGLPFSSRFPNAARLLPPRGPGFAVLSQGGSDLVRLGLFLLLLGLLGAVATTGYWLWSRLNRPLQHPFGTPTG
jgi:hypothetical protein